MIGDFCRKYRTVLVGCSGKGRPTCQAPECLYGAEPCPNPECRGFRPEGFPCNWCGEPCQLVLPFPTKEENDAEHDER